MPRQYTPEVTANITANGQILSLDATETNTCLLTIRGTYSLTLTFEASRDGTNWFPIQMARVDGSTVVTTHSTANQTVGYEVNCHIFSYIRARCSAYTSGTAILTMTGSPIVVEPAPTISGVISGTVTANQGTLATGTALSIVTTASTNLSAPKTSAGNLFEITASNPTATPAYVKLYNKASNPTLATDVPVMTIPVPANSVVQYELGSQGKRFATGIAVAVTGAIGATDATNAVAGVQIHGTYI